MLDAIRGRHLLAALLIACFCLLVFTWPYVVQWPGPEEARDVEQTEEVEQTGEAAPIPILRQGAPAVLASPRVNFTVKFKEEVSPYRVLAAFVMPEEDLEIEALLTRGGSTYEVQAAAGRVGPLSERRWRWTAPDTEGLYPVTVTDMATGESVTLNAFVMVPFDHQQETLNGYRIGRYQAEPYQDNPLYERPPGFVEVTPENEDVLVSPHFTLGQFVAKQESGYPKYLVLQERLLLKLEMLLEELNKQGIAAPTFHVMSAYRTPFYNAAIGNTTKYSAHLYGAAADIFVDADGDGYMDDLTGDGRVSVEEAKLLADIVERMGDETWYQPFIGGLGIYAPASHRGPFIHVDVRGEPARW